MEKWVGDELEDKKQTALGKSSRDNVQLSGKKSNDRETTEQDKAGVAGERGREGERKTALQ